MTELEKLYRDRWLSVLAENRRLRALLATKPARVVLPGMPTVDFKYPLPESKENTPDD